MTLEQIKDKLNKHFLPCDIIFDYGKPIKDVKSVAIANLRNSSTLTFMKEHSYLGVEEIKSDNFMALVAIHSDDSLSVIYKLPQRDAIVDTEFSCEPCGKDALIKSTAE